jgi:hypothetical protein
MQDVIERLLRSEPDPLVSVLQKMLNLPTQSASAVTVKLRDELHLLLTTYGVQNAKRIAFLTMTRQEAFDVCVELLSANDACVVNAPVSELLLAARIKMSTPQWSPELDALIESVKRGAALPLELPLPKPTLAVLLSDAQWRTNTSFTPRFHGPACYFREVKLWKSPPNLASRFPDPPTSLPSEIFVLHPNNQFSYVSFDMTAFKRVGDIQLTCDALCGVPSTSTLLTVTDGNIAQVKINAQGVAKTNVLYKSSIRPMYIDCTVGTEGTLFVQVAERNDDTGGFVADEMFSLHPASMEHVQPSDAEFKEAEALDELRLHQAKSVEFDNHGNLVSLKTDSKCSIVCFADVPILTVPEALVAALGCPQDMVTIAASGLCRRYKWGELVAELALPYACTTACLTVAPFSLSNTAQADLDAVRATSSPARQELK